MAASDAARAGAALLVVTAVGLIAVGQLVPHPDPGPPDGGIVRHTWVDDDAGAPGPSARCFYASARAAPAALAMFGLGDAGTAYVRVRICANPSDSGIAALPSGLDVVEATESTDWPYDGGHSIETWLPGASGSPFDCACAPRGGLCKVLADDGGIIAGAVNLTYGPGKWTTDSGCLPKTCVELAGSPSMPSECL